MAPKRPREEEGPAIVESKKRRSKFDVGPQNLPDGTWRRKGTTQTSHVPLIGLTPASHQDQT